MSAADRWLRYKRAVSGESLPVALVDLDAVEVNLERLLAPIRAANKRVRLATKSLRCPALLQWVAERSGEIVVGYMTYTAAETAFYASAGVRDLMLGYPTVQAGDAALLARANRDACAAAIVDDREQLRPLAEAARGEGTRIPIVIDVDMSWRPLRGAMHLGVRRSPLRDPDAVVALARRIADEPSLRFHGLLGYEAQLAGVPDRARFQAWQNPLKRAVKRGSRPAIAETRARVVAALAEAGFAPAVFNGGGTGSVDWSSTDDALTEITVGSGLFCGHLFDNYRGLELQPALAFGLQVIRRPGPGLVTCLGGGWIASGAAGADRLPRPSWPLGCELLPIEGAGEVQTPVAVPNDVDVALGDPIFFRPAKSGELAEHVTEYLLVRGDRIVGRAPTYRGLGQCFLG
ncbi:MAG TPA: alanine racemase [Kofleriaceae bacterium]|nr:alanine racemase [Kofleriaceae bacterium]